jgi:acyl carrier protein
MTSTINPTDVEAKVLQALSELGGLDPATLRPTTSFEEIDIDSLDLVELGQIMEEQLDVMLETADISELKTIGDAVDLVCRRLK